MRKRAWRPPQSSQDAVRRRAVVPSWMISVAVHLILYVALVVSLRSGGSQTEGPGEGDSREVGIYVKESPTGDAPGALSESSTNQTSTAEPQPQDNAPNQEATEAALAKSIGAALDQLPQAATKTDERARVIGAGPTSGDLGTELGIPGSIGGSSLLTGSRSTTAGPTGGGGLLAGGQAGTRFFQIEAQGTRFVYVIDHSGSMGVFKQLAVAKAEVQASLQALTATHQFQIIFYNDAIHELRLRDGPPSLNWASDTNKVFARQFLFEIQPDGGTNHVAALRKALNYKPEHIFFLTDADEPQLSAKDLADIKRANAGKSHIHCVEFGKGVDLGIDNFLRRLARENGGSYRYRDIQQFNSR